MAPKRFRIRVVDDLLDMAESTAEMLALWGYDATACDSGTTGLACARARRPDAVLLDLAMPRMDGFEFARAFRGLPGCATVPLVAVSGYSPAVYATCAREAGIDHYLLKPADLYRLQALLASLTRSLAVPSTLQPRARRRYRVSTLLLPAGAVTA
jgi:CheY-like chemotaxis protein